MGQTAESQRQMNETYSVFVRGRLPKYEKPKVDFIDNLTSSVIIDQSRLGGNARSTVGTISDLYSSVRLLFHELENLTLEQHLTFHSMIRMVCDQPALELVKLWN